MSTGPEIEYTDNAKQQFVVDMERSNIKWDHFELKGVGDKVFYRGPGVATDEKVGPRLVDVIHASTGRVQWRGRRNTRNNIVIPVTKE